MPLGFEADYSMRPVGSMGPMEKGTCLYLTTTGWKSGRPHEIEIWYTEWEGRYYVVAERGGQAH